jgi:phosphate:Na+ symporter
VLIFFPFISELAGLVEATSPNTVRQIANAHTFFNLSLGLMFLPFTGLMAKYLNKAVTEKAHEGPFGPKYLDEGVLSTPSLALSQASRETIRMADVVQEMLSRVIAALNTREEALVSEVEDMDDHVDKLDRGIRFYLAKLAKSALTEEQSRKEIAILAITSDLENIGDIIDKHIMYMARKRIKNNLSFSKEGFEELGVFHKKTMENFAMAVGAFAANDMDIAERIMRNREKVTELEKEYRNAHIERLRQGLPESHETSAIHLDVLSNMERINAYITHIAFSILEARGEA